MASTYPSVVATLTYPNPTQTLNSPSHSSVHGSTNDEIIQIETFVGTLSSTVGTLVYDIRSSVSSGGGHIQGVGYGGTGITSYNKGDLLVGGTGSVISRLAISATQGYALVVDNTQSTGLKWGLPGNAPSVAVYSTPSTLTWVKPSVFSYLVVECVGGGGGGEKRGSTPPVSAGAGSGAYTRKVITASTLQATETFIIGAGGVQASIGGTTSFGTSSYLASGGGNPGASGSGGAGGSVLVAGDININGFTGGNGLNGTGGNGADTPLGFGHGAISSIYGGTGATDGYGSGGKGGESTNNGVAGAPGILIITQF